MDIREVKKKLEVRFEFKKLIPFLNGALRAIIGFLLSRAVIFTSYAPFGIAYSCASSPIGIIGAIVGYLTALHKINGLKYSAICILAYTANYVFRGTRLLKKRWFMPLAGAISTAVIGFIFVADAGFKLTDIAFYITEILLLAIFSYFYQFCYRGASDVLRRAGLSLLLITLVIPLSNIDIFGLSIGRTLASASVMLMGYLGGAGVGSATGIALSFVSGEVYYSAIYGLCGLLSPIFRKKGEYIYAISFLVIATSAMLWTTLHFKANIIFETVFGTAVFIPVEHFFGDRLKSSIIFKAKGENSDGKHIRNIAKERLKKIAEAYKSIGNMFAGVKTNNEGNIASVFSAPVEKVCKKCVLSSSCWERDYITTKDALNKVCNIMEERGEIDASDFPHHFGARCIKIEKLVNEINYELKKFIYRRKCNKKIGESRAMLAKQYNEVSNVMSEIATELNLSFDEVLEIKVDELLQNESVYATAYVYRDVANHLHIEIEGEDLSGINNEKLAGRISEESGVLLALHSITKEKISICEKEVFSASIGAAISKKQGEEISGDAGSYFKSDNGHLSVILADGMGSGADAAKISTTAIKLIERFVRAGINPELSLKTISSAMLLSNEQSGGFTTVDFMRFDLYNGMAEFYKLGSAPTYVKRAESVRRICSLNFPAGVPSPEESKPERFTQSLREGDFVVFTTDGVSEGDDLWLYELISNYDDVSTKKLADEIIATATAKDGNSDDMTVLVMRVDKSN